MARQRYPTLLGALLSLLGVSGVHGAPKPRQSNEGIDPKLLSGPEDVAEEYDYIVVGGGTAGLTVADRLSEDGDHTVLVIELGAYDNSSSVTTIAGGAGGLSNRTHLFSFPSSPQEGLNNRTTAVIGGVMLGGSSGVNGLQVHRGHKDDYNRWGAFFSDESEWSWDGLLPYFKKAWNFHPPNEDTAEALGIKYDASYWGDTSGVHASFPTFNWPGLKIEIEAFGDIEGVELPEDSGEGSPGVYWYPTSADPVTATRSMSRNGHFDGIDRDNYKVLSEHRVLRVLFDEEDMASGVAYVPRGAVDDSEVRSVKARKEVIIAAGTIHTPQILQGSGIGAADLLEAAGIEVVVDLPGVGWNLQDHPLGGGASFELTDFPVSPQPSDLQSNASFREAAQQEFKESRSGPLTIASGNAACFLPLAVIAPSTFESIASRYESQDPAAYLPADSPPTIVAGYAAQQKAMAAAMRSRGTAHYNLFLRGGGTEGAIVYLHPVSRGTVRLDPSDPYFSEPEVDYRALSNPADLEVEVEFVKFTRRYFTETRMADYGAVEARPGGAVRTDEEMAAYARANVSPSTFHPVGTAAMLPRELGGVVDEGLRVYGVKRLSVVDASVMPDLPGAYTQHTTFAIAEKAADLIKARA
ncbi:related to alcohol oxidase [Cephalotrichum gorgonifer]|uniref:Related to alcohol oxidase n=1 Tax=Cephalotrichum gorgonifer TaxID=2041049 RepID=A0AAE8N506_9PEZI|nr:related to alcohol oxidase [Cephalotrichum gorgonifer]